MEDKLKADSSQSKPAQTSNNKSSFAKVSGDGNKIYQDINNSTISDSSTVVNIHLASQNLDVQLLDKKIEEKKKLISWLQDSGHITLVHEATAELNELEQRKKQLTETLQRLNSSSTEPYSSERDASLFSSGNHSKNFPQSSNYSKTLASQELHEFQSKLFNSLTEIPQNYAANDFSFTVVRVDQTGKEVYRFRGKSKYIQYLLDKNLSLDMAIIPEGDFLMGPTEIETKHTGESKKTQHNITVNSFCISIFPITKKQWSIVAKLERIDRDLKVLPYRKGGYESPITNVSWLDTIEFCRRLSQYLDVEFRLPTEVEWEYACRAGTQTPFHFGPTITTELANYDGSYIYGSGPKGKSIGHPLPVKRYEFTNSFGLIDMHGNVCEWCADKDLEKTSNKLHKNGYRLLRGGSWNSAPSSCRSAYRLSWPAQKASNWIGFRVAFSL